MRLEDILANNSNLALVRSNVYEIPERLRQIDSSYFVVWNNTRKKYEVHSTENIGNTYCFTVPFNELDQRTLQYARETSVKNHGDTMLKKMREHNQKIEKSIERERKNMFRDSIGEVFDKQFKIY